MTEKQSITATYKQIIPATAVLRSLLTKPITDMRGTDILRLARMYKTLEAEANLFTEQHTALIIKHGGVEIEGELTVPPDRIAEFVPEFSEMAETEVALPFSKLPDSVANGLGLPLGDILAIEFLFK